MSAPVAFLTFFLGLVSGKQSVELRADSSVASIRITLAGQEIARLTQPPWRLEINLGDELVPRELAAIGFDVNGNEVGRASQVLNLPHESAEVDIELQRSGESPDAAQLRWRNLEFASPKSATVTFDGAPLRVDSQFRVHLPKADWARPHVVDAMMRFADGMEARREAVIDGATFSETARSELTPVLLIETSSQHPSSFDGCFSIDGAPVLASAVEKESALVIFVQDPDPGEAVRALDPAHRGLNPFTRKEVAGWARLDNDTTQNILWPVVRQFRDSSASSLTLLFEHTRDMRAEEGLIRLLTYPTTLGFGQPRRYADAVAIAGIRAMTGGRRRAAVFVLSEGVDASGSGPAAVRRYLASIGVPLFVWSPIPPSASAAARWGVIDDISTIDHLRGAVARLKQMLAAQRIAWIHADAFSALRVKADERCGVTTVAR